MIPARCSTHFGKTGRLAATEPGSSLGRPRAAQRGLGKGSHGGGEERDAREEVADREEFAERGLRGQISVADGGNRDDRKVGGIQKRPSFYQPIEDRRDENECGGEHEYALHLGFLNSVIKAADQARDADEVARRFFFGHRFRDLRRQLAFGGNALLSRCTSSRRWTV